MKWKRILREEIDDGLEDHWGRYDGSDWYNDDDNFWDDISENMTEYEYLPTETHTRNYKNGRTYTISTGRLIDMNSIYDKQTFRKKQIERVLGIDKKMIPTLGDIYECSKGT